ncbi:MAG: 2-oxoglutarate/2-oxoacid ferredoxin oxidoreductase subunit alpha [Petroclostridium sp.]|jgi:2-oxoglutarate ferredoxin oxidoreductase subunit alpha|uniref:3-methyl-2-oxobutanoate dehydrogenase subunit VorB n=1 Tax=Petroclostridium xylanilyticum TaxID=1792311 RepID=UPI000B9936EE|nr:3-methyl-2-oxobutanoate dehydrogenase subunit VorB [Petroclostridium xylanilyticum]MBZ4644759.1 3-methyl-2-oxobutanoate dehydrogenase subunit VorB [Clostridia bacterium]MDK2810330.1 2-oxoglutarate/2-oxoacid ferredoxin oxidoreductase subunit alpha [Petroclostridium sp.]
MSDKVLMKGNEAIAEAAIQAGCRYFFGYPITPQNEIPAYMSKRMPKVGGVYLQAESEVAAINMVYGAAGAGARVMTSSSSPGISLKQEGISYIAGSDLPCVIVNIVRGGPGLGGIQPAQSDYFQAVKGGAHGDYYLVVLAPSSIQEAVDLTMEAFDIADMYRTPVMVIGDGMLGQMMEPVQFKDYKGRNLPPKDWATTGTKEERRKNVINSLYIDPQELEIMNLKRFERYKQIQLNEVKYEMVDCEDADVVLVAYGTTARVAKSAMKSARAEGFKVGLIRPITLWPFPVEAFQKAAQTAKAFLTVEMSMGQMVEDVRLAVNGAKPVYFYGRTGGMVPTPAAIIEEIKKISGGEK